MFVEINTILKGRPQRAANNYIIVEINYIISEFRKMHPATFLNRTPVTDFRVGC